MAHIELVIFDFDGTLVDTAPDLIRATNRFLAEKGFPPRTESDIRSEIGLGLKKLILDLYPHEHNNPALQQKIFAEFTDIYNEEFLKSPTLFHGAREFLHEWNGKIAIVSNKRMRFINPILRQLGIDRHPWTSVIGGDTFTHMKPHPEPFVAALAAAGGIPPEKTLVVGDGTPDVEGALAVGSRCLAVEFGYTPVKELIDLGACASLSCFTKLKGFIESIT